MRQHVTAAHATSRSRVSSLPWLCVLPVALLPACDTELLRTGGNSDRGYFEVQPDADLAVGGRLTYTVRDYEAFGANVAGISFRLQSASNDAAAHIVSMTTNADLVVDGLAPGESQIAFEALADGEAIEDGFAITVRDVTRLGFSTCRTGGVYVRGLDGPVAYTFNPGASRRLLGLGLYPFVVEPAGAVALKAELSTTEAWTFAIPASAPDQAYIVSSLPGDAARFSMTIVDRSTIDGVVAPAASSARTYDTVELDALPTSAGRPVCGSFRRVVTAKTPLVCQFYQDGEYVSAVETTEDRVTLAFRAAGMCAVTISFPELGLSFDWQPWTVTAPSGGGGGSHHDDWD